ncbi:MAG TPA: hypothetical protein PKA93_01345 [Arachnia sp.]|nr:hypothetical protein [Arachnia sp.]
MSRPTLDVGALALGLAAVGFGLVLVTASHLSAPFVQPILAAILIAAGGLGLLLSRVRPPKGK